ncbi:flagellar basal-body MS-ring/collar protein FliF [Erwinia oleae]|uniref:flagellar basal-body MS-ring/collar protein FliF n=1 Tax=Erwinia oleae TaxID=796334 RepID=UPI00068FF253|nr:flagellar basal-body MS-ring/collar protein FliF [Erwinia oleae]
MGEKLTSLLAALPLDRLKKSWLPIAGALAATAVIVAMLWYNSGSYTMLFGSQENLPVAQVVEVLGGEKIPYRIEPQSGRLLVKEGDLPKARMMLAAKGIRAISPAGYELMDKEEMLGSSQFIQNVRFRRSMEGELAQSIMALDAVSFARVHLGISETSSFVLSNKPDSTASVMLRLRYGQSLDDEQVAAVVNLVSGSVPGMKPQQVRVVDQHGALLSANIADTLSGAGGGKANAESVARLRHETERNLTNLLTPIIGSENFRISVVPRFNFSQVEETQERLLGEPRVNNENLNQENTTDQLAMGIPGSLSNRPVNQPQGNAQNTNPAQLSTRNQAQRQYSYDRNVLHIRHPAYQLEKLSIAVVLNKSAPAVQAWTQENQSDVQRMLNEAAGIDAARGDALTLSLLSFSETEPFIEPALPWWERQSIIDWSVRGGIALLALIITLFGLLPMLKRIGRHERPAEPTAAQAALPEGMFIDDEPPQDETSGETVSTLPASSFQGDDNLPPQSSGLETKIAYLQTLAQSETDRVAEVIKQWISSNERSSRK